MIRISLVDWMFNKGAWAQAIQETIDEFELENVAELMAVSPKTVSNWIKMYESAYGEYPHPTMANFIRFCNTFHRDPREFFILEDK